MDGDPVIEFEFPHSFLHFMGASSDPVYPWLRVAGVVVVYVVVDNLLQLCEGCAIYVVIVIIYVVIVTCW